MSDDVDMGLLYEAIDQKREAQGLSWAGMAKAIGIAVSTIKGIRDRKVVEGDGVLQMLLWLGRSPESLIPQFKAGKKHELKAPKNTVLRFDVKEAYCLLEARRLRDELTWVKVAEQIGGLAPSQLQQFKKGGRTSFRVIMRVARWLDVPAKDLTKESPY